VEQDHDAVIARVPGPAGSSVPLPAPARPARPPRRGWGAGAGRRLGPLLLFGPGAAILLALLVACLILFRYSLNRWDPVRTMIPDWTIANYLAFVSNPVVRRAFVTTLRISAIVTVVCLVLGYPVAYAIARSPRRKLLIFLLVSPMLMDVLIRAFGWLIMLSQQGLVNVLMTGLGIWAAPQRLIYTELSVILELIHELVPFMVLPIASALEQIDPSLGEAAMNLRAGPVRRFLAVTLPLSVPGVVAGTLLTFALAMSAFSAPLILGGGNVTTMTMLMRQQMFATLNWPLGSAQAVVLVLAVVAMLALYGRLVRRVAGRPA
jgi:putative spermidine/putrescine transport system permease protein